MARADHQFHHAHIHRGLHVGRGRLGQAHHLARLEALNSNDLGLAVNVELADAFHVARLKHG